MHAASSIHIKRYARPAAALASLVFVGTACAPALDWRRLQVSELGLSLLMPCKPQRVSEGSQGIWQCEADGLRFMLTWQRLADPQQAQQRLATQADAMAARLGAQVRGLGATGLPRAALPWGGGGRFRLEGGEREAQLQVWVQGLHLCQALVVSQGAGAQALEAQAATFMDSLQQDAEP